MLSLICIDNERSSRFSEFPIGSERLGLSRSDVERSPGIVARRPVKFSFSNRSDIDATKICI